MYIYREARGPLHSLLLSESDTLAFKLSRCGSSEEEATRIREKENEKVCVSRCTRAPRSHTLIALRNARARKCTYMYRVYGYSIGLLPRKRFRREGIVLVL